ncbi:hypothetical protein IM817_12430 [Serratia marcescens]|uniref:hypothetical protein n=1 Tax=Serratia marcescens TaxID=615 RepID=UPI001C577D02|nr:hypothetical protein [Serratia marcescens]QXX98924.1 hypothetical protein IM817_12430 [Serratia marcescens]
MNKAIFILLLVLVGCGNPTPTVTPEQLSDAVVGYPYMEMLQISGGALNRRSTGVIITPENSGLKWKPKVNYRKFGERVQKDEDFHNIIIYGTPNGKGKVTVEVSGFTLGTMYPGKGFFKSYEIEVR